MTSKSSIPDSGTSSKSADNLRRDAMAREAVAKALDEHRRMGRTVSVRRDGKIVQIGGEELQARVEKLRSKAE